MAENYDIETIFNQFKSRIFRLALSISRNEKDAEDITQNTFLKIIRNLKFFRGRSQLSTWIYKVAYNEALMHLRKKKSQFKLSANLKKPGDKEASGLFVNWAKLPDKHLLDAELKERIGLAISSMPIKYRMALLLDNVEELPLKESAQILNLKINSLKTRLHRARLLIKSDLADYFKDSKYEAAKKQRKCGTWVNFVYDYSKGGLGKARERSFRRHISDCRNCKSFLDMYHKAIEITKALECQDIPLELKEKIESFVLREKS